ncbi:flagellar biosynthesis protein FlhF [Paraburkholderia sp.]|uniref:flagellar biosynthesis protein FlhF n=1 Tax=Paraburkholderia sp. TaxID=1926495 RepID=UPI002F41F851
MNIRKFVGATSRDALRLVREALGPDAVVLSNRTIEDGTVEIVALADSELAAITPKARNKAGTALPALTHGTQSSPGMTPVAQRNAPMMQANPYASGMPDVFSSVFGASPEAGTESMSASNAPAQAAETAAEPASGATAQAAAAQSLPQAVPTAQPAPQIQATPQAPQAAQAQQVLQAPRGNDDIRADLFKAAAFTPAPAAPRTMAESNPWLIDHARAIASKQQGAYSERASSMTPAAAMAKGLGAPVEINVGSRYTPDDADAPDWAREAAQLAARRAAQKAAPNLQSAEEARATAASVTEAIKARMEQVVNETVMSELSSMRGMMEEHFAGLLWADRQRRSPVRASLTKHLFAAGFSAQLVQMMVDNLPPGIENMDGGMDWVRNVLESNLPVMENEDALMERGGVFALMGPTGVGKTTTTAKLAARCVMRFGASKVALLTTDSYRIGGHEQLRIFGKILGVSVHAVKDGGDLQLALAELRNKHIVLIDTIGMSQRDRLVSDQIAMLCRAGQPVQRLLLLNATSHGDTLNEVVQAYQRAPDQQPLAGCILTKLDEATNLGGVLDTVIRYKLPVHYVSTGQKVPENLYVATRKFLIKSAFCIPRDSSPFVPHDEEIPALLSALSARSTAELHEVRFG